MQALLCNIATRTREANINRVKIALHDKRICGGKQGKFSDSTLLNPVVRGKALLQILGVGDRLNIHPVYFRI